MSEINLKSEVSVDYTKLRDLLQAQDWAEADTETLRVMLLASKSHDDYVGNMKKFPCIDLSTIDQLWSKYSNGRFGFSIQKQIWYSIGGQLNASKLDRDIDSQLLLDTYSPLVGWKKDDLYLNREDLIYSLDAPPGQLPAAWVQSDTVVGGSDQIVEAWLRMETCDRTTNKLVTQEISEEMERQAKRWHRSAIILHSIYLTLGIISVFSSVLVATFTQEFGQLWTKAFAATSAISVALIETTGVGRKGNGFRQAQRHLRAEIIRYRAGESSTQNLSKAFAEAESMIGDVVVTMRDSSNSQA